MYCFEISYGMIGRQNERGFCHF
jgi:hypothetical protein